jgi:hypothetical protein
VPVAKNFSPDYSQVRFVQEEQGRKSEAALLYRHPLSGVAVLQILACPQSEKFRCLNTLASKTNCIFGQAQKQRAYLFKNILYIAHKQIFS